jgi:hypothetical protein
MTTVATHSSNQKTSWMPKEALSFYPSLYEENVTQAPDCNFTVLSRFHQILFLVFET